MIAATMLMLAAATVAAEPEAMVTRPPIDPATLTLAQAKVLNGSEVLVTEPAVGMFEGTFDGFDVYDLGDGEDVERYLFVPEGARPADLVDAAFAIHVEARSTGNREATSIRLFQQR